MYGGEPADIEKVQPAFDALKPEGDFGAVHAGKVGAGHFSKMVHNGIEYAMMQSYAEGFELLEKAEMVDNVTEVFRSWREGTVIRSWLLDLLVAALDEKPGLEGIRGYAEDSGEGRWTVEAAIEHAVPMPAIAAALFARFVSRQDDSPAMQAVAAMRNQFGGPRDADLRAQGRRRRGRGRRSRRRGRAAGRRLGRRTRGELTGCTSRTSPSTTSGRTPPRTSPSTRASPRSSAATGRARPTWSRPSTTSPA